MIFANLKLGKRLIACLRFELRHRFQALAFATRALTTEQHNPTLYLYVGRAGIVQATTPTEPEKRVFFVALAIAAFENLRF